ncbi:flavoprotein-like protein [Gongronella butleri]|nr:flavoprotein-like protein [Gongronella butleri]
MASQPKVYLVIYSLYKHVYKLAEAIKEGLEENGCEAKIFQVKETLPDEVLEKMHVTERLDVPVITADELVEADGILFGIPTRFGIFPAQMKSLLDATGQLWAKGSLGQKFAGTFFSTASSHGGRQTTAWNAITYFSHHGMMYVPFGFANQHMFNNNIVIGGSAYGSGTLASGDGSREPIPEELEIAKQQGQTFAKICVTYVKGKAIVSTQNVKSEAAEPPASPNEQEDTPAAAAEAEQPAKKKGKGFWCCCGNANDLD